MLLRFLFGNDIFISYSRKDGNLYATRLAEELASRGFTCIIDVYEGIPEAEIPRAVMRALRRSYQLVVVGTREAAASPNVAREIRDFPRIGRSRVVVGFDGSVEGAAWQKDIQGLAVQNEDSDALRTGPSQGIVDLVQASFRFKRQKQRLAISFWTTLATIALMLAGGGTWLWSMGRQVLAERAKVVRFEEQVRKAEETLRARQEELQRVQNSLTTAQDQLVQERENVRQQQRLAQARRLASDLQARRSARVYSPPEDVLQAIEVSNILGDFGLDLEAHAVLAGAIEALPRRVSSFRAAAPIRASAMAGDRLLTVSDGSRRVEMWDLRSGRLVKPLPHAGTVSDLAVSRDGAFAVTRTRERVAHLWELATAAERGTYRCSDGKGTSRGLVAVSREGRYIALLCGNGDAVQLFERGRDSALATVQEEHGTIREMQFSKDLRHLAVIWSEDFDSAALYDIGQQMAPLPMERECFAGNQKIRFGAEAGMVVSSRVDGEDSTVFGNNSVRICRLQKSGSPVRLPHSFPTNEEFTSDGKYLATGEPSTVRIWTTGRGEQTTAIRGPAAQPALSFSPDDRYLAIRWSGELWIVESPSGRMAAAIPVSRDWSLLGWSAEGHMAVLAHRPSGRIEVWEIQPIQKAKGIVLAGRPIETGFSSSGQELLTVDRYETPEGLEYSAVQVWSMETGKALFKEEKMGDPVSGGGLSVDGTKVAVFTPHYGEEVDGSLVEVFDVGSRRLGERIEAQVRLRAVAHRPLRGWIGLEAGSHRTRVVAIAAGGTKVLWQGPEDARFVSGGRFVAAVGESGRGRIFDVDRGREIRVSPRLKLYSAMDLLLTNGGRLLAAIPEGDLTRIADLETGATQSTLPVPAQVVRWSPGGKFLLTAADGVARVWELPGGVERAQTNYMGEIGTAAFSSDTLRVALGVNRGVSVWAWRTDEVRKRTCAILGVNRQSPGWSTSLPVAEYRRICGRS